MKKIFKIIIKKFAKNFVAIASINRIGRYFNEYLVKYIFEQKRNINYKNIKLAFYSPNRLNKFRIDTFSSKEPETLSWIEKFNQSSIFWDIGANIGLYSIYSSIKFNSSGF